MTNLPRFDEPRLLDKPLRQALPAAGKEVNAWVDQAIIRRNTGHKLAADYPWRKMSVGNACDGHHVKL